MARIVAIIPCAGYGTRMGMLPNQSKEMLIDPRTNEPIIKWSLDLCKRYDIHPIVITRSDKLDLIEFLNKQKIQCDLTLVRGEWPDTILDFEIEHGCQKYILILPDTRFSPIDVLPRIEKELDSKDICFGVHKVDDVSKWGAVKGYNIPFMGRSVCEKPKLNKPGLAWGVIGFNKNSLIPLFEGFKTRNKWTRHKNTSIIRLDTFIDITRTGTIL